MDFSAVYQSSFTTAPLPPICYRCGSRSVRLITSAFNLNGNAGRPYYKCLECPRFLAFADDRGNDPSNPECNCGIPSKSQRTGRNHETPGALFYTCSRGACNFFTWSGTDDGTFSEVESLSRVQYEPPPQSMPRKALVPNAGSFRDNSPASSGYSSQEEPYMTIKNNKGKGVTSGYPRRSFFSRLFGGLCCSS